MKTLVVRALLLLCSVELSALNSNAMDVSGTVADDKNKPVEFANVVLLNPVDSTYIGGAVTDLNGAFQIPSENPGLLRVSCLGFDDAYFDGVSGDVGQIVLLPSGIQLAEVEVKASRPVTRLKNDALVTLVAGTPLSKMGTGVDVLGMVPRIVKNGDDIEVIGKGKPLIYINGRLMRNESELDQLSSAQIKDVEVVTTPGARYDASVNSVIRITTVKPVGEGFGFDSRTVIGVKHHLYGLEELNFNYRSGKFDLFGMAEYDNTRDREFIDMVQTTYSKMQMRQMTFTQRLSKSQQYAGKLGFNFAADDRNSFGLLYDFSYRPVDTGNESFTSMQIDYLLENELTDDNNSNKQDRRHLVNAYYSGNYGGWALDVNLDGMFMDQDDRQYVDEVATNADLRKFVTKNAIGNRLLAAKAVASRNVWKGNLSFGTEWSFVHRTDIYDSGEDFIEGSNTKMEESNGALFVEMAQNFGKLEAIAGLRYEHVNSGYYDDGVKSEEQSRVYDNLFPSAMVAYPFGSVRTRLSYSRKITRPAYDQLNSNVKYVNRYTYQAGNPLLRPSYRDYVSFAANWRWINFVADFTHTSGYIMSVYTQYGDDPEIALLQKRNAKSYNELQAMVNLSPQFGIYHPQLMCAVRKQFYDVVFRGEKLNLGNPMGIVRFNNAICLPGDVWVNADLSWRTEGNAENLFLDESWQCDLGVYKSFGDDKWSVKLQCNDLFKTANTRVSLYSDMRKMVMEKSLDTRNFSLTVRFKFNAAKSKYKGTGAGDSEKSRLGK